MTTMPTDNDPNTNPLHPCAQCSRDMGRYHYTDGTVVELCPGCDAPHADELACVMSDLDAEIVADIADWIVAYALKHVTVRDVVFASMQVGAALTHAGVRAWDVRNPAVRERAVRLIDAARRYALEVIGTRLEADRAEAVAHAYVADRAAKAARRATRKNAAGT